MIGSPFQVNSLPFCWYKKTRSRQDCLIIHVPERRGEGGFANLIAIGAFGLADLLAQEGYRVRIINLGVEAVCHPGFLLAEFLARKCARVIALSLQWHYQVRDVLRTAKVIRQVQPRATIVLGGMTATMYAADLLGACSSIDCVVRGDAERPMIELMGEVLRGKQDFSRVENLSWRADSVIVHNPLTYIAHPRDLNGIRYGNLTLLRNADTYLRMPISMPSYKISRLSIFKTMYVAVGRGCSVDCSYCGGSRCSQMVLNGRRRPIYMSQRNVVATFLAGLPWGVDRFHISFDPYPLSEYYPKLFRRLGTEKIQAGLVFESWGLPSRGFIDQFSSTFGHHRLSRIVISPETGSETSRVCNKGLFFTNQDLLDCASYIVTSGLQAEFYFAYPLPGEKRADVEKTLRLMDALERIGGGRLQTKVIRMEFDPASPWDMGKFDCQSPPFSWTFQELNKSATARYAYFKDVLGKYAELDRISREQELVDEGVELFKSGKYGEAITAFRLAMRDRKDDCRLSVLLAICLEEVGDVQEAERLYRHAACSAK